MKITKSQLKQIIKEEIVNTIREADIFTALGSASPTSMGQVRKGKAIAAGERKPTQYPTFSHITPNH